jgi:hypothetical protein
MSLSEILVVHHTHTDWGYTSHPSMVEAQHYRYIDQAVDLCRRYRDRETSSPYRWTCESSWVVHGWMKSRAPRERRAFLDCVRRGEIEVAAMPLHPTPLADSRTIAAALKILDELRAEGIPISVALICDINGLSWPWADALLDHGVTTLCTAMNFVCGGGLPRYTAFHWQSASGRKLLCWQGTHYNQGAYWGINYDAPKRTRPSSRSGATGLVNAGASRWREVSPAGRLAELKDYPYEKLLLQVTNIPPDNGPPHPKYLDYTTAYNRQARQNGWPAMRPASLREWADYLSGQATGLPVWKGDWTDWWASGAGSTPRETAALMEAQRRIGVAEQRGLPAGQSEAVRRKIFLAAEHTWGGSTSTLKPYQLLSLAGLAAKQEIMYAAVMDANEALRASLQPRYQLLDTRLESFDPSWNEMVRNKPGAAQVQPLRKAKRCRRKVNWKQWLDAKALQVILEHPVGGSRSTWFEVGKFDRPDAHGRWGGADHWKRKILQAPRVAIDWKEEGDTARIEVRVKLDFTEHPRSLYVIFPFRFQSTILADVGGAWADPLGENIPGSCKNWWTIHRGILMRGRAASVLWTPWDAPLVMFDEPCPAPPRERNPWQSHSLVSWALNTYWYTNFPGLSGGDYLFRYRLKWWPGPVSKRDAEVYCASDPLADYPQIIAAS